MRWKNKEYKPGDTRIISRLLLFPRRINNETRWLEYAKVNQIYAYEFQEDLSIVYYWQDLNWVNP